MNRKSKQRVKARSGLKLLLMCAGGAALVTACGSVSSSTSGPAAPAATASGTASLPASSPSPSATLPCKQITSLRMALAGLSQMTARTVPVGQIETFVAVAQRELTMLASQAGSFSAEAGELRAELSELGNDARQFGMNHSSADMAALRAAVSKLKSHAQPLIKEMQAVCPNP